MCTSFPE